MPSFANWSPGGIRKEVVVSQAETVLAEIEPANAVQHQRLELAYEQLDDIRRLDAKLKRSKARVSDAVTTSATRVYRQLLADTRR